MKRHYLLATAAAALLITTGAASAQNDVKKDEAPGRAPAAQQHAPAEKIAPTQKIAPALKAERKTPETTGQAPPKEPVAGQMEKGADVKKSDELKKGAETDKRIEPHAQNSTDLKANSNESAAKEHNATTGQGAAAGSAKLSTEQRTKITTIFQRHRVAPAHLDVAVRVGTRVPESVHFYPLPVEVVDVYPEWRGYDYILVGDEIVVIDPHTHEIVAVLEA